MACQSQQPPAPEEEHQSSDDLQNVRRGNVAHQPRCTCPDANQANVGKKFDINLSDECSTNFSQPNSQIALPLHPQTNNNSQMAHTPAMSQEESQQMSLDIKHYF